MNNVIVYTNNNVYFLYNSNNDSDSQYKTITVCNNRLSLKYLYHKGQ